MRTVRSSVRIFEPEREPSPAFHRPDRAGTRRSFRSSGYRTGCAGARRAGEERGIRPRTAERAREATLTAPQGRGCEEAWRRGRWACTAVPW
eukprot:scaffold868_cov115-Isochrysis_galbana.AAC.2